MARAKYCCGWCNDINQKPHHEYCPIVVAGATCACASARPELHPRMNGL